MIASLSSLASNSAYSTVIAQGAKNAAIAFQYGHNYNVYSGGTFIGNEDFAREYHQLFFGILGEYDHRLPRVNRPFQIQLEH